MAAGNFKGLDASGIKNEFGELMQQPGIMIVCMIIVVAACFAICKMCIRDRTKVSHFLEKESGYYNRAWSSQQRCRG